MHRGYQGAFNLGVPIWLNVDKDVVRPGADLNFFGGFDIGYAVFGLALGAMWTPMNLYNIPGATPGAGYDRSPMTRLYFAPEVRVQVPNNTPVLPYLGITFDANWWRVKETDIVCGGDVLLLLRASGGIPIHAWNDGQTGNGFPRILRNPHRHWRQVLPVGDRQLLLSTGTVGHALRRHPLSLTPTHIS